jgi:Fic family protein
MMADGPWELLNGPVADDIERLNGDSLMNFVVGLVKLLLTRQMQFDEAPIPNWVHLSQLHIAATVFLLTNPGELRECDIHIVNEEVEGFTPPPAARLAELMNDFFHALGEVWKEGDALDVAAYAIWRLSWLHPFTDGNGRTAMAFAYACLCLKLGALLPGRDTLIDRIKGNPHQYLKALRAADRTEAIGADLTPLKEYLDELLLGQINESVIDLPDSTES